MPLGVEVGLRPGDIVLDGDPDPLPKTGHSSPHFTAHVYCGQTAGCIRIPLGIEVGPGNIVLHGDLAAPTERDTAARHFSARVYCGVSVAHLSNCCILVVDCREIYVLSNVEGGDMR